MPARSASMAAASPKPLMVTLAPSLARALAMARPIPLVEPVTRALRLASDMGTFVETSGPRLERTTMATARRRIVLGPRRLKAAQFKGHFAIGQLNGAALLDRANYHVIKYPLRVARKACTFA